MQCFICMTYIVVAWCSTSGARFLLRDVQLPLDSLQSTDHDVTALHRDRDVTDIMIRSLQDELSLPSEAQYLPRPNRKLELLRYHHRQPKNLAEIKLELPISIDDTQVKTSLNGSKFDEGSDEDATDTKDLKATLKPKKNRPKINKTKLGDLAQKIFSNDLVANTMAGASQIGNAKSQTVIKPTIIVNVRGSESNVDARFDNKMYDRDLENNTDDWRGNEFNINQRIRFDSLFDVHEQIKSPLKQTVIYDFNNANK